MEGDLITVRLAKDGTIVTSYSNSIDLGNLYNNLVSCVGLLLENNTTEKMLVSLSTPVPSEVYTSIEVEVEDSNNFLYDFFYSNENDDDISPLKREMLSFHDNYDSDDGEDVEDGDESCHTKKNCKINHHDYHPDHDVWGSYQLKSSLRNILPSSYFDKLERRVNESQRYFQDRSKRSYQSNTISLQTPEKKHPNFHVLLPGAVIPICVQIKPRMTSTGYEGPPSCTIRFFKVVFDVLLDNCRQYRREINFTANTSESIVTGTNLTTTKISYVPYHDIP